MIRKRIAAKRSVLLVFLLSLCLQICVLYPQTAQALTATQTVYDNAALFSEEEGAALEELCAQYGAERTTDMIIVTENGLDGNTRSAYLEDFYAQGNYSSAVLLLINMDPADRGVQIQGYGDAQAYITEDTINAILDDIVPQLSDGDYYDAMCTYLIALADSLPMQEAAAEDAYSETEENSDSPQYNPTTGLVAVLFGMDDGAPFYLRTYFLLGVSVLIGIIVVGIMAANAGGTATTDSRTYLDETQSRVVASRDRYIRTAVTRVKRPQNNNDDSHGGGGSSHSDGGRSF